MERGPGMIRNSKMAILTFRGHRYEPRVGIASKPCQSLTYRRATYLARREEAIVNRDLCVPEGFIRSKRTAELIGLSLVPCSRKLLVYRGIHYVK